MQRRHFYVVHSWDPTIDQVFTYSWSLWRNARRHLLRDLRAGFIVSFTQVPI